MSIARERGEAAKEWGQPVGGTGGGAAFAPLQPE
jgi:hypothetical protein